MWTPGLTAPPIWADSAVGIMKIPATAPNIESLPNIRPLLAQYLFDSLHDWHLKILLVAAIVGHFAQIFFEGLQINHSIVAFGIIETAEPCSDKPRLIDFVMHELVTVDFRNVDCHLGLGRSGDPKGKDDHQRDAHAFPWHKDPSLKKSQFSQSDPLGVPMHRASEILSRVDFDIVDAVPALLRAPLRAPAKDC
jgi:hypothetical protein